MAARIRLQRIEGNPVTLHFSPNYHVRARTIGRLVAEAHEFLAGWLEVEAQTTVSILRRENWRRLRRAPYGYPHSSPERATIFVPATYPPPWIERSRALYEEAPTPLQERLCEGGKRVEERIVTFYDLVVVHELGHLFIHHLQLALGAQWLREIVANLFAVAFFVERRPELADCWFAWAAIQASLDVPVRRLADYESAYGALSFANASYFQGRFNQSALELWRRYGYEIASPLIAQFSLRPDAVTARWRRVAPAFQWPDVPRAPE